MSQQSILSGEDLSGPLGFLGSTSGRVQIQVAAVAGTWTLTLPIIDGDAGQFLQTDGSGVGSWATAFPTTVASVDLTAQSAAVASVAMYTTPSLGTYRIGAYVSITAIVTDVLQVQVTWTDENSTSRTQIFFPQGVTSANLAVVGFTGFSPIDIRAKSGTSITVATVLTTSIGTITYDAGASISRLY